MIYRAYCDLQCLGLRFKQGLLIPRRHRTQEECLPNGNRPPYVRLIYDRGGIAHVLQVDLCGRLSPQPVLDCGQLFRGCPIWWVYCNTFVMPSAIFALQAHCFS